jgi:transposase
MEDVLSVYQRPYDPKRPQVCLDEISKVLRSTPRGELPMEPGQPKREDYEYQRHGTCALFLAVEPLRGFRRVWVRERRTKLDFAEVLRDLVDVVYPEAEKIVLVVDNLNIHHPACLYERFEPGEARRIAAKVEWHYTPEHASWLNIAECELSVLKRQCLKGRLSTIEAVEQKVTAWQAHRNQAQIGVDWRFTTNDARIKLKRLYPIVKVQESA